MKIYADDLVERAHHGTRLPSSRYKGQNGFFPDATGLGRDSEGAAMLSRAVFDQHRTAQYILTQKDSPIPSLQEMEKDISKPDTIASVKEKIEAAKKQHTSDLERLYLLQSEEYLEEAHDRYLAKDDLLYLASGENNPKIKESYTALEKLYERDRRELYQLGVWNNDYELMRYTHMSELVSLYRRLQEVKKEAEAREARAREAQKRREAEFPASVEEFFTKPEDVQRRAVLLLTTSDPHQQERLLTEYGWAWRQVRPLQEAFQKQDKFKAEIMSRRITIDTVKDPRKRF